MNVITRIMQWADEGAHRFTAFDLKLVQFMGIFVGLIIVKLIPEIIRLNIWWFFGLFVLCSLRPVHRFFWR